MTEPDPELYETCSCHVCATLRSLLASDADPQVGRRPMETAPPLLLTTDQASVMLGVTRDVVSQLIGQGEVRSVEVLTYGRRRIPRAEIEGYVARLLSGQLRYWVEARAELHQWGLKYMGQKTTYRLRSGSMATRSPRKWHLGDGRTALCGASSDAWEVSGYTVWIRWSKVCDECEVRRDQIRAEKLMTSGTKSRYLGPAELRPMLSASSTREAARPLDATAGTSAMAQSRSAGFAATAGAFPSVGHARDHVRFVSEGPDSRRTPDSVSGSTHSAVSRCRPETSSGLRPPNAWRAEPGLST